MVCRSVKNSRLVFFLATILLISNQCLSAPDFTPKTLAPESEFKKPKPRDIPKSEVSVQRLLDVLNGAGIEGRDLYLYDDNARMQVHPGKPFLHLSSWYVEKIGKKRVWEWMEESSGGIMAQETIFPRDRPGLRTIEPLRFDPRDTIVVRSGNIVVLMNGLQFGNSFPDAIHAGYDFDHQDKPVQVFVIPAIKLERDAQFARRIQEEGAPQRQFVALLQGAMAHDLSKWHLDGDDIVFEYQTGTAQVIQRMTSPTLAGDLRQTGVDGFPLLKRPDVDDSEGFAHLNWLFDVAKLAQQDRFLKEPFAKTKELFDSVIMDRKAIRTEEINVKLFTMDQIERDFADPATSGLIRKELNAGIRYIVLTRRGEDRKASFERLARGNVDRALVFDPTTKKGQIHIMDLMDNETVDVNELEGKFRSELKNALGKEITQDVWKAFLDNPNDETEFTNFVAAFDRNLKLKGDIDKVRHCTVEPGTRLSEVLCLLQGLFTKSFKKLIRDYRPSFVAAGYSQDELNQILQTPGDYLIPPQATAPLLRRLSDEKRSDKLVDWAA